MVQVSELHLNTNLYSLGAILGTSGHQDLIDNINRNSPGGSFFGSMHDPFRNDFNAFMGTVIEPIRQVQYTLMNANVAVSRRDSYRSITSEEDLKQGIPPCMQLGVLYHAPIRQLLDEERIDGFGYKSRNLDDEDPYELLLASGHVEIHSSMLGKNGEYTITHHETTVGPELTSEEVMHLRNTREYLDEFMRQEETKYMDPTDYPSLRA